MAGVRVNLFHGGFECSSPVLETTIINVAPEHADSQGVGIAMEVALRSFLQQVGREASFRSSKTEAPVCCGS